MDNVNNLNGVPNFGLGEQAEQVPPVVPTEVAAPSIDEVEQPVETKVKGKKTKKHG